MERKQKIIMLLIFIAAIYLVAIATGFAFLYYLFSGQFLMAISVLLLELCLLFIGKELRKTVI
tara:strand:- start:332 stop:520 length:189 start_codon:yes stop_codon:yes gene_type:complete